VAENVLAILVIFAAPIPWWLILLHLAVQKEGMLCRFVTYFSIGIFWLALAYPVLTARKFLFASRFQPNSALELLGILLLILALVIDWQVLKALGFKRLICLRELQKNESPAMLVTSGIYRHARHPRYVEYLFWSVGLGLIFGYAFLLWFGIYLFSSFWLASYFEEVELVQRFGQAYVDYQKSVPRFFIQFNGSTGKRGPGNSG
jgi:protein-S-isoprenylcysteine O-methyltransferase Ste14